MADKSEAEWRAPSPPRSRNRTINGLKIVVALTLLYIGLSWQEDIINLFLPSSRLSGAHKVLNENPLIDGHNDLLILIRSLYDNHIYGNNFSDLLENGGLPGHFDFPRAEAGQLGGSFWSAFVSKPCFYYHEHIYADDVYRCHVQQTALISPTRRMHHTSKRH
jgi:hypothetical protein